MIEAREVLGSIGQCLVLTGQPVWAQQQCRSSVVTEDRAIHRVSSPLADGQHRCWRSRVWEHRNVILRPSPSSHLCITSLSESCVPQGSQLGAGSLHQHHLRLAHSHIKACPTLGFGSGLYRSLQRLAFEGQLLLELPSGKLRHHVISSQIE